MVKLKPITVDTRKAGYEDLYEYITEYANKNCKGKLAAAVLEMVRDHQQSKVDRKNIMIVQGDRIIGKV